MIGFLGGTFDPIHNGHLHAADTAAVALELDYVALMLAARPQHRASTHATIEQRWSMLELAIWGHDRLRADDREMLRDRASYTIDTLDELRAQHGSSASIVWLVGWDAYRQLPTWHRWRELLRRAHLGVLRRPGCDAALDPDMQRFTGAHRVDAAATLRMRPAGNVCFIDAPMLSISSTDIRARLGRGEDVGQLLPPRVWTYIRAHDLYAGPPSGMTPL